MRLRERLLISGISSKNKIIDKWTRNTTTILRSSTVLNSCQNSSVKDRELLVGTSFQLTEICMTMYSIL
jgi:hypothetical protein